MTSLIWQTINHTEEQSKYACFFVNNKGGREDGVLGRLWCEVKLLHQWFVRESDAESSLRFDRHFAGRYPAFFSLKRYLHSGQGMLDASQSIKQEYPMVPPPMPYLSAGLYDFTVKNGLISPVDPYAAAYRMFLTRRDQDESCHGKDL